MKIYFLLFFLSVIVGAAIAQPEIKNLDGNESNELFFIDQNVKPKNLKSVLELMEESSPAYQMMEDARNQHQMGSLIGFAGCGLLVYTLVSVVGDRPTNVILPLLGVGFTLASIRVFKQANRKVQTAIDLHNTSIGNNRFEDVSILELKASASRIGVFVYF